MTETQFERNRGLIPESLQDALWNARVAVAGVGGVGGRLATRLAAVGIGHLVVADLDDFSVTNVNRQEGASFATLGQPKTEVIGSLIHSISPEARLTIFDRGIDADNLGAFVDSTAIVFDATDYTTPGVGLGLAQTARRVGVPMATGVELAFGAYTMWFHPTKGRRYEHFLGIPAETSPDALASGMVAVEFRRWIPHVPNYVNPGVLQAVSSGELAAPAIAPGVDLCSAMLTSLAIELIAGKTSQRPYPHIQHIDVHERRARSIRWSTLHHRRSTASLIFTNRWRRFPLESQSRDSGHEN